MRGAGRVWHAGARLFTPWKNGGGETAQVLSHPEGAGFDDFAWRISTARVERSGPFSRFEGVSRSLTLLEGGPLHLRLPGREVLLDITSAPFAFDGAEPCEAELPGAALLDLNVMTRRPLRPHVRRATTPAEARSPALVRYLFALAPQPELGLERHDLLELAPDVAAPDLPDALFIAILKGE